MALPELLSNPITIHNPRSEDSKDSNYLYVPYQASERIKSFFLLSGIEFIATGWKGELIYYPEVEVFKLNLSKTNPYGHINLVAVPKDYHNFKIAIMPGYFSYLMISNPYHKIRQPQSAKSELLYTYDAANFPVLRCVMKGVKSNKENTILHRSSHIVSFGIGNVWLKPESYVKPDHSWTK